MVMRFTMATGVPNFTALLITLTDRSVSPAGSRGKRVVDLQPWIGGGECCQRLAAAIDRDRVFDGCVFDVEVNDLQLVLVDHCLICRLQAANVAACLSEFQTVVSAEGDEDVTAVRAQLSDFGKVSCCQP